jgi:hypothetical protein
MGIDDVTADRVETAVRRHAGAWLFPLIIGSFALAQVRSDAMLPVVARLALAAGQGLSIVAILVALAYILAARPDRTWPIALVALVFLTRGFRFAAGESARLDGIYTVCLAAASSAAGALVLLNHPGLVRRQFAVFCALSIPLMVLQMIGVPWSQALRSDLDPPSLGYHQVPTLFVPAGKVVLSTLQLRPAGFLYANNAASIIAVFGLALHYARLPRPGRIDWSDVAILSFVVLLMSRLAFVVLGLMWLFRLMSGADSRRHVLASFAILGLLMALYRAFFPGLFAANTSLYAFALDLELRVVELMLASGIPWLARLADMVPREWGGGRFDPMQYLGTDTQSGYALVLRAGWLALVALLAASPVLVAAARRFATLDAGVRRQVVAVGLTFVLVPAITSFLGTAVLWFLSAGAFIPLWTLLDAGFAEPVAAV